MVWGAYLEKNFPSSNGHFLDFGGQDTCQDGLGHFLKKDLTTLQNGKIGPEKSAHLSGGAGGPSAIWAMPKCTCILIQRGFPQIIIVYGLKQILTQK